MALTLHEQLKPQAPSFSKVYKKYKPMLELVKILIGNIPNADPILEIWPTGFKTYNLLVPNLLNLPNSLFGSKSIKTAMGLAMYRSSMAAGCMYCSAHTCSFALRRGISEHVITGNYNAKESAIVSFSEKLSSIPIKIIKEDYNRLVKYFTPKEIETITMSVVLMGFLNKFMDAFGTQLEQEVINDVANLISPFGWETGKHLTGEMIIDKGAKPPKKDNLLTYIKIIRLAPGAVSLESSWNKGVPNSYELASTYLKSKTGHDFPILQKVKSKKIIKALTIVLRDNLSYETTVMGLETKLLCGLLYSIIIENKYLIEASELLLKNTGLTISEELVLALKEFALKETPDTAQDCKTVLAQLSQELSMSKETTAALILAKGASYSPAQINESILKEVAPICKGEAIVEMITWISILQALHRLESYMSLI